MSLLPHSIYTTLKSSSHTCILRFWIFIWKQLVLSYWAFVFLLFQNTEAEKGGPRCVCLPHESPSLPPKVSFFLNSPLVDTRFVFLCFKTVRSDKDRGNPYCTSLPTSCSSDCWGRDLQSFVTVHSDLVRFGQEQAPMCFC